MARVPEKKRFLAITCLGELNVAPCWLTFATSLKPPAEIALSAYTHFVGRCTGGNWNLRRIGYNRWYLLPPESRVHPMHEVTRILSAIEQGEPQAAEQLLPLVYEELRKLAAAKMAGKNRTRRSRRRHWCMRLTFDS